MNRFAIAATFALLATASLDVAPALPNADKTCTHLGGLKAVLPQATTVGFRVRQAIRPQAARAPIWPGRCGGFWTTYEGSGAPIDVSVALYETPRAVAAPLAEPGPGPIRVLRNGARVRVFSGEVCRANYSDPGCVPAGRSTVVVSAYRRIFIHSTSVGKTPASSAAQLRLHRAIQAAFRSMG